MTGSIGIYAFKLDLATLVGKLGITTETTTRGGRADLYSMYRPWREDERAAINARIRNHYDQFLKTVAGGRKQRGIDEKRADDLGRGRVYTGAQAKQLGLVDQLGGIATAIDEAARRGRIPTGPGGLPELVLLPITPTDPLETLLALRRLVQAEDSEPPAAPTALSTAATLLTRHGRATARLSSPLLADPADIQARMPYDLKSADRRPLILSFSPRTGRRDRGGRPTPEGPSPRLRSHALTPSPLPVLLPADGERDRGGRPTPEGPFPWLELSCALPVRLPATGEGPGSPAHPEAPSCGPSAAPSARWLPSRGAAAFPRRWKGSWR